jgi:WD40 repeat protein
VWDVETGTSTVLDLGDGNPIEGMAFTPDGDLLAASGGKLRRWDLAALEYSPVVDAGAGFVLSRDGGLVLSYRAGTDPSSPVPDWAVTIHDLAQGSSRELGSHADAFGGMSFDPTASIVVTRSGNGQILAGPVSGEEPHLLIGHPGSNMALRLAVSPDGRWIAAGSGSEDIIRLWPMPDVSKPPLHTLPHDELIARLKTLTNLRIAAAGEDRTGYLMVHDPFPGWEELPELPW